MDRSDRDRRTDGRRRSPAGSCSPAATPRSTARPRWRSPSAPWRASRPLRWRARSSSLRQPSPSGWSGPSARSVTRGSRFACRTPRSCRRGCREVLAVLYLVFNEGYLASTGEAAERRELARDAEWLTSLVARLMPDEPEVLGLLALMRLHLARADARFANDGSLVLLPDQDRGRWDAEAIASAVALLRRAERMGRPGPYQLQAAIVGTHAMAPSWEATPWPSIVGLYDALLPASSRPRSWHSTGRWRLPSATAHAAGWRRSNPWRTGSTAYHLYHAARGELLLRVGDVEAAAAREPPGPGADRQPRRATAARGAPQFGRWRSSGPT